MIPAQLTACSLRRCRSRHRRKPTTTSTTSAEIRHLRRHSPASVRECREAAVITGSQLMTRPKSSKTSPLSVLLRWHRRCCSQCESSHARMPGERAPVVGVSVMEVSIVCFVLTRCAGRRGSQSPRLRSLLLDGGRRHRTRPARGRGFRSRGRAGSEAVGHLAAVPGVYRAAPNRCCAPLTPGSTNSFST